VLRALHALLAQRVSSLNPAATITRESALGLTRKRIRPISDHFSGRTGTSQNQDSAIMQLWDGMDKLWKGWSMDSSVVAVPVVTALQEIVNVARALIERGSQDSNYIPYDKKKTLMATMISVFPYSGAEAASYLPTSQASRAINATLNSFNLSICDVVISLGGEGVDPDSVHSAHSYVLVQFHNFANCLETQALAEIDNAAKENELIRINGDVDVDSEEEVSDKDEVDMDGSTSTNDENDDDDPELNHDFEKEGPLLQSKDSVKYQTLYTNDTVKRIFSCVNRIIISKAQGSASSPSVSTITDLSAEESSTDRVSNILLFIAKNLLTKLMVTNSFQLSAPMLDWSFQLTELVADVMEALASKLLTSFVIQSSVHEELCELFSVCMHLAKKLMSENELTSSSGSSRGTVLLQRHHLLLLKSCNCYLTVLRVLPVDVSSDCVPQGGADLLSSTSLNLYAANLSIPFEKTVYQSSTTSAVTETVSMFQAIQSSSDTLSAVPYRLLDIYYYTPMTADVFEQCSRQLIKVVCHENIAVDVQSYFIKIFFERYLCNLV
jgi:hypothetical protein